MTLNTSTKRPHRLLARAAALAGGVVLASSAAACGSSVTSLELGQCLDLPDQEGSSVTTVKTKSCGSEHQAEVFKTITVEGDTFPADITQQAQKGCMGAFKEYIGTDYPESALDITYLAPTQESWEKQKDRTIACIATPSDGSTLTKSVKNSKM